VEALGIAPYSENAPTNRPYHVCPPARGSRASCKAVAIPAGVLDQFRPSFEGSGVLGGYSPADLASAYKLPSTGGSGQTIAIIDAYDDPKAEADLAVYREHYGLSPCTTANGCFKKVNQKGETKNYPEAESGWALETSLDLDMASAICPECKILLVEANDNFLVSLGQAVNTAVALGATEISNSYGAFEFESETEYDKYYNHPGIPITVSSGDGGYSREFPASSPYVIAVGGTALRKDTGSRGWAEEAWAGAGSACSLFETKPAWQKDAQCGKRTVSDVSAVAAPSTGVSIYDSFEESGWIIIGGTSASAPIIAGVEALSSSATRAAGAEAFYKNPNWLFDISGGSNGTCTPPPQSEYLCTGGLGYDGPTGNGTPNLTPSGKPAVAARAVEVDVYDAVLQGSIDPEGSEVHYRFEYGTTVSYGQQVPAGNEGVVATGTSPVTVNQAVYGLKPEQQYHYRLVASNAKGTTYGEDRVFSTRGPTWAPQPTYSSSFGSYGTGDGQFKGPTGLAVEPTNGLVVVADEGNNRIEVFTPSGEFVRKFGSAGTGNGQFKALAGVATDSKGNIWVADAENNRIQEFTEKGEFIRKFGTEGTGNGQLRLPFDVAVDSSGNVWVADGLNQRIQEFTETGTYVRQFAAGGYTYGVAIDSKGNVWNTAEGFSAKIQEHTATGTLIRSFGNFGSGNGQVTELRGLTVDANGNVWVADSNHDLFKGGSYSRVEVFTETGVYEGQFGVEGSGAGQMAFPFDVALDPSGNVWVTDNYNNRVQKWKVPSPWPPTYSSSFGTTGSGDGQLKSPLGVAVEPTNGLVVVADEGNNRIEVFTPSGEFVRKFGSAGTGNGQFKALAGVATDSKGNIWVADAENNRIQEFTEKGEFIRKFGTEGTGNGQLRLPFDVAVDSSGNVWVADGLNQRIQEFTETGTYVRQFAAGGYTYGVAIDSKGNVWNTNTSTSKMVQEHSATGSLIRSFGIPGEGTGELADLRGLTVDSNGNVWVIDSGNNRVQVFGETGTYLTKFGGLGSGAGQMAFPFDVALDPSGNVWVTDNYNNRVQKWSR
jgi:DNA-binding beta-propeller fold protein YncE